MFTRKRWVPPILTKDWERDGPNLLRSINEYLLSLEAPGSLAIDEYGQTTPTVTSGSGAFTTVAGQVDYVKTERTVTFHCTVTITTNGTAATSVIVPMPYTELNNTGFGGYKTSIVGLTAAIVSGNLYIFRYDGAYPGADGVTLIVSGSYII